MHEIFSFAQRPRAAAAVRGRVTSLDPVFYEATAVLADGEAMRMTVDPRDCSDALRAVVELGGDAVCVECEIVQSQVVLFAVLVDPDVVDARLAAGDLPVEEHLVHLATSVWREARVPAPKAAWADAPVAYEPDASRLACWREDALPPHPHQRRTVGWMRAMEASFPRRVAYSGNLRITDRWYLDTENECFVDDPSPREAQLVGGLCTDGLGSGKTASVLRLVAGDHAARRTLRHAADPGAAPAASQGYASGATLVLLPLNLVSQWREEVAKFLVPDHGLRVVWLVQAKDMRHLTMADLCAADLVVTTLHFLRASRPYVELVETALEGRARERAVLSAWARRPGRVDPVLEAVTWRRIVVDEVHQVFERPRELRQLKLFRPQALWGLTATPVLDAEPAQHLYAFLQREKAHHPNLLAGLIDVAVRSHAEDDAPLHGARRDLEVVRLTAEERVLLRDVPDDCVEEMVRRCTFVDCAGSAACSPPGDAAAPADASIPTQFRQTRDRELLRLRAKAEGHERSVRILEKAGAELDLELQRLAERCAQGDETAEAQAEVARAACDTHERDLATARQLCRAQLAKVERHLRNERFVADHVARLHAHNETCCLCGERPLQAIAPGCSHLFCRRCVDLWLERGEPSCPKCRNDLVEMTPIAAVAGIGSKMGRIGEVLLSLDAHDPAVLFVQWRSMVRGTRAFLRSLGLQVFALDGNGAARAATLTALLSGGVLVLCLEECFAGLHLPHVGHIVFAHAIVGDRDRVRMLERQAVARCLRPGQTRAVRVYSFVVADSEEWDLWERTHDRVE